MRENTPSRTALRVAMHRAAHQILDVPRIFPDPLALRILGMEDDSPQRDDPSWLEREREPMSCRIRAFVASRSRYAEDELRRAVQEGVRQYAVLGAGLDTFAFRNPHPGLRVFEVDHPATQAWKKKLIEEAGIPLPPSLAFAPIDFETQTLREGLERAGFDAAASTFFSWLGVTQYIERDAVEGTLAFAASMPAGSGIVFDYTVEPSLMSPMARRAFDELSRRVALAGEPFRTFFDPSGLMALLRGMGFGQAEDIGPGELNARYFQGLPDARKVRGFTRLAHARV